MIVKSKARRPLDFVDDGRAFQAGNEPLRIALGRREDRSRVEREIRGKLTFRGNRLGQRALPRLTGPL